jgi:membrane-associated phospholipid phosphatase
MPRAGPRRVAPASALAATALFLAVTAGVETGRFTVMDTTGIHLARALPMAWLVLPALRTASFLASGAGAIPIALAIALYLAARGRRRTAWFYTATCLSGWAAELLIKEIVRHPRPVGISPKLTDAGWYSYPSGHAMLSVLVFGLGVDLLTRGTAPLPRALALGATIVLIGAVCLARVYLGAHWPSDVVGAVLAGIAWAAGAEAVYEPSPSAAPYTVA